MTTKLTEIKEHLEGILLELKEVPEVPEEGMSYTELKMQLMINYVTNLSYYLSLRVAGESVAEHPVFAHLAYLRTFMERLAPLDASLKYEIDKLLLQDARDDEEAAGPNLAAFVPSAVKNVSVEQMRKATPEFSGRMELDPAMIAAQIQKVQQRAVAKKEKKAQKSSKVDDQSELEDGSDFSDESVPVVKKHKKVSQQKKMDSDDEEIDSDLE